MEVVKWVHLYYSNVEFLQDVIYKKSLKQSILPSVTPKITGDVF